MEIISMCACQRFPPMRLKKNDFDNFHKNATFYE